MRKEARVGDVLLLLEHSPVITLGRNARAANVLVSTEQLAKRGVERLECDRGGDVTFHGPGQLVAYPIFDLHGFSSSDPKRKNLGAVEFVRRLEEALIRTCAAFGISTERVKSLTGVWTCASGSETRPHLSSGQAKIAAIGVHISRAVTSHGFALNVNTDLDYFKLIVPCGIVSKTVTSLAEQTGAHMNLDEVARAVARHFAEVFASDVQWVETLDALLGRQVGVPMRPPADLRKLRGEEEIFLA